MSRNAVIFGHADGGKSTLLGFIKSKDIGEREFEKRKNEFKVKFGERYEPTRQYALLIDDHQDEIAKAFTGRGQSIYSHEHRASIGDLSVLLIDTPGFVHRHRERLRGIFYGEIAILVVEAKHFYDANKKNLYSDFSELSAWVNYGYDRLGPIVVVSKMDTVDYQEAFYKMAKSKSLELTKSILGKSFNKSLFNVIPTAVQFDDQIGHNIIDRGDKMQWFDGDSLVEALEKLCKVESNSPTTNEPLLFCTRKQFNLSDLPGGIVIEGKLISGEITPKKAVKLCPVKFRNEWTALNADVSEIRLIDTDKSVPSAAMGDLASINLSKLRIDNRRVKRESLKIANNCIAFEQNAKCLAGNILKFIPENLLVDQLELLQQMVVLWYGRQIVGAVVAIDPDENAIYVELHNSCVAIMEESGSSVLTHQFLLRIQNDEFNSPNMQAEYFSAKLNSLGTPNRLILATEQNANPSITQNHPHESHGDSISIHVKNSCYELIAELKECESADSGQLVTEPLTQRIKLKLGEPWTM